MIKAGNKTFKSQTTLTNFCKFILNNADLNKPLEGEWFSVMDDVLRMHDNYHGKIKGQQYSICVRKSPINARQRQFYILREDGSDTDFSYYKAISNKPTSKIVRIKDTLKAAVKQQTIDYKDWYFEEHKIGKDFVLCEETGLKLKRKDSHIDHYPKQFDEIVEEWVKKYNVKSEDVELIDGGDNTTVCEMVDKDLLESFVNYHKEQATYRIVLNKVNLQRKRPKKFTF